MSKKPLTAAQQAQQKNRNLDGTYRENHKKGQGSGIHISGAAGAADTEACDIRMVYAMEVPPVIGTVFDVDGRQAAVVAIDENGVSPKGRLAWTDTGEFLPEHVSVTANRVVRVTRVPDTYLGRAWRNKKEREQEHREARSAVDSIEAEIDAKVKGPTGYAHAYAGYGAPFPVEDDPAEWGITVNGFNKGRAKAFLIHAFPSGRIATMVDDNGQLRPLGDGESWSKAHTHACNALRQAHESGLMGAFLDANAQADRASRELNRASDAYMDARFVDERRRALNATREAIGQQDVCGGYATIEHGEDQVRVKEGDVVIMHDRESGTSSFAVSDPLDTTTPPRMYASIEELEADIPRYDEHGRTDPRRETARHWADALDKAAL